MHRTASRPLCTWETLLLFDGAIGLRSSAIIYTDRSALLNLKQIVPPFPDHSSFPDSASLSLSLKSPMLALPLIDVMNVGYACTVVQLNSTSGFNNLRNRFHRDEFMPRPLLHRRRCCRT